MPEGIKLYNKEAIDFYKNSKYTKATMQCVYNDLEKLREASVKFHKDYIFWLNYYKADAPYMGWSIEDPEYQNMCNLTKEIETLFLKMYILVEKGLGNKIEVDE